VHVAESHVVFIGYPLDGNFNEARMIEALDEAKMRFGPAVLSIIASTLPGVLQDCAPTTPDMYYRLDVSRLVIPKKTDTMLKRARRDLSVSVGTFRWGHKRLLKHFMRTHRLDGPTRFVFERVPEYVKCDSAVIFEARNARGKLVAFDIAEFGAQQFAFYMFNCRSHKYTVPGASDLLLAHIIERAQAEGKRYINLGLGIDAGITFFKKKWGATQFLKCVSCVQNLQEQPPQGGLFDQLSS
jgi:hypothetical protein